MHRSFATLFLATIFLAVLGFVFHDEHDPSSVYCPIQKRWIKRVALPPAQNKGLLDGFCIAPKQKTRVFEALIKRFILDPNESDVFRALNGTLKNTDASTKVPCIPDEFSLLGIQKNGLVTGSSCFDAAIAEDLTEIPQALFSTFRPEEAPLSHSSSPYCRFYARDRNPRGPPNFFS